MGSSVIQDEDVNMMMVFNQAGRLIGRLFISPEMGFSVMPSLDTHTIGNAEWKLSKELLCFYPHGPATGVHTPFPLLKSTNK